jgi:NADH:ubiquinone oxidoreductase subunit 5 (subunit L)/multisubunit Na+/H+ antiporter MnhA subunit
MNELRKNVKQTFFLFCVMMFSNIGIYFLGFLSEAQMWIGVLLIKILFMLMLLVEIVVYQVKLLNVTKDTKDTRGVKK